MKGRVVSLQIRTEKHGKPAPVAEAVARVGGGIEGDVHAHRESRAVLVVDRAALDALGLRPGDLREEITIEGLPDVTNLPVDTERSEEHTSELQSQSNLVCRLLLEKKKKKNTQQKNRKTLI